MNRRGQTTPFIYAGDLKNRFNVFGRFYNLRIRGKILKCRSTLDIVSTTFSEYATMLPDAVVVMMNPGSSRPLDQTWTPDVYTVDQLFAGRGIAKSVPTRPDNAQYQIMRVMVLRGWQFVKVLNLSDLRNGNSGKFSGDFENAALLDSSHPHCITHPKRKKELSSVTRTKTTGLIIAAWGSIPVLQDSADTMLANRPDIIGVRPDPQLPWFRYASPYMKKQKIEWVRNILIEIEEREKKNRERHA